ncbi:MAG: hypothetical protein ACYDB7_13345 [Mycobacteriales bacterium]
MLNERFGIPLGCANSGANRHGSKLFAATLQAAAPTDRRIVHRLAQFALAVAFILTIKLFAWADRWNR